MDSAAAPTPAFVAKSFVNRYYYDMYNNPEFLHHFYKETSKLARVGQDGVVRHFSTLQGIKEELKTLTYGDFKSAVITSYDAQQSYDGGVFLLVTGYFTLKEKLRRKFTQSFFLARQETGFFVLNDILSLSFVNEDVKENVPEDTNGGVVTGKSPTRPILVTNAPTCNKGPKQASCVSVNPVWKEVSKPLNNEKVNQNVLVPEIVKEKVAEIEVTCKEVADISLKNCEPHDGPEDVPKKCYASVLKVKKDKSRVSAVSSLSPKQIPKDQEHQAASDSSSGQMLKKQGQKASSDPSQVIESDAVSEIVDANESWQNQEGIRNGTSIYVKHLPANANIDMVETELKQFGSICIGGFQVINHRKGYGTVPVASSPAEFGQSLDATVDLPLDNLKMDTSSRNIDNLEKALDKAMEELKQLVLALPYLESNETEKTCREPWVVVSTVDEDHSVEEDLGDSYSI